MKYWFLVFYFLFLYFLFLSTPAHAASLSIGSDTITTSRPSASAPLQADLATTTNRAVIFDNGSLFLASDSAILRPDTGETLNTVTIASMSAANTPSSGQRTLFFTANPANTHHAGIQVTTAVSAMHTVKFNIPTAIPASGKILITFPGSADTSASPSASTFPFNGLTSANAAANISYKLDGTATCTFTVSAPTITCAPSAGIAAGTAITFLIGCADASTNTTTCTTQSPRLINPTKSAAAGTADIWTLTIKTQDGSSTDIDSARIKIATIDTVQVQATVDSSLTFTITGIADATAVNTSNTTGCTNTETTNTGIASTAVAINLGNIGTSPSIAAQRINVTTNNMQGYTVTATSSGQLINPANGFWINSSTSPAVFPAATPWFGIHACGLDANTTTWGTASSTTTRGSGAKYGWPTQTTAVTLASDSSGPIDNSVMTGNGITTVEYAVGIDATVPAGTYASTITYVVTPTF